MKNFLTQLFQTALNRYLALDPESTIRLRALENKIIHIELLKLGFHFQLHFTATEIQLSTELDQEPDVIIKGTPLSLFHMTIARDNRHHFFGKDVLIEGNLELGQQIIDLFDQLEIDWEEYLSRLTGDVSAHQFGRVVRGLKKWTRQVRETLLQDVNEYIHEEINLSPPREALEDFFSDIDTTRMDADRLEARIKKLWENVGGENS